MAKYLQVECAAARAAAVKASGRNWWEAKAFAHESTGHLVHVCFHRDGEAQQHAGAYIYDPATAQLTPCDSKLGALDALLEAARVR